MSLKIIEAMMATIPVIIEDKDTYFEKYNVIKKERTMITNNNGLTPKTIPPEVATALPPLNLAKTG